MNPILLEVPTELATPRLSLRAVQAGDGHSILDAVRPSLPELMAFMPWAKDDYGLDDAETWCRQAAAQFLTREQLAYLFWRREGGPLLGNVSAHCFDWQVPRCEIGYWLRTDHTGQGFMTEAVHALRELLLTTLGVQRVEIRCDHVNLPGARVAERSGFALDAVLRNHRRSREGQLGHTRVYSRTAPAEGATGER